MRQRRALRRGIVAVTCIAALVTLSVGSAFAGTITTPSTHPFVVPGDASGNPMPFDISGTGFPAQTSVFAEMCDGVPASTPGWSPTDHCDLGSSKAPEPSDANGNVTFPASDPNHAFPVFKGLSPQSLFNCLSLNDPIVLTAGYVNGQFDPNNGAPDWDNCQLKLSTSNTVVTGDQALLTLVLPDAPAPPVENPPVAANGSVSLGIGKTKTITLSTTDTDATPTTACNLVGTPSSPRLAVSISNAPNVCEATLTDSGTNVGVVTFQFNATDGVATGNTATETVNIGTPPVDEPLTQQVNGGQLLISCTSPDVAGAGPQLQCPDFQFPAITLNGLQQTSTGNGSTLYVSDNRGDPTVGWTLTGSFVPTPIGAGSNTNANCAGVDAFCNADVGAHALDASGNGQISPSHLSITNVACTPHAGNANPAATAGSGGDFSATQTICTAAPSQSGGTFDVSKKYSLTIPASVYAGEYWGTVEYVVQ